MAIELFCFIIIPSLCHMEVVEMYIESITFDEAIRQLIMSLSSACYYALHTMFQEITI